MGTPHLRCRLIHQSLRPCVMDVIRRCPLSGIHCTSSIAASAASLHTCRRCLLRALQARFAGDMLQDVWHPSPIQTADRYGIADHAPAVANHLKPSTEANHWSVALKMIGCFVRQS